MNGLVLALIALLSAASQGKDAVAIHLYGLEELGVGRFGHALDLLAQAVKADPENPRYRIARGAALLFAEQPEEAIPDLDRALHLSDRSNEARMWRAAADRMCARFFTEIYPQATRDPFESTVGEVSAFWGQTFRAVEQGYEPSAESQAAIRARLADLRRWYVERSTAGGDAVRAAWNRGKARADSGDWAGAAADLARAFQAWPEDTTVLNYQAGCRLSLGDAIGARELYTRVLTAQTTFVEAYYGRARAAAQMGDTGSMWSDVWIVNAAKPELNQGLPERESIQANAATDPGMKRLLAGLANRTRLDERYQDGLREREAVLQREPDDPTALADLALFLFRNADVPRVRVEPRGEPRLLRWQTTESQERGLERAERLCDEALAEDPEHVRALVTKAAVRIWNLQYGDAETLLRRALQRAPRDAEVLELLAKVLDVASAQKQNFAASLRTPMIVGTETHDEGDYEVTTTWWRHPSQAELARADELERQAEQCLRLAIQQLENAAAANLGTAKGLYYEGLLARRVGDLERAKTAFGKAVRRDAQFTPAWFHLADTCGRLGQSGEALAAYGEGLNQLETTAAPWLQAAWREIERTRFESARTLLAEAERRDPIDSRAAIYRALCSEADGDVEAARREFRRALALEDARATLHGTSLRADDARPIPTELVGRAIAMRLRLGRLERAQKDVQGALELFLAVVAIEPRLARGQDVEELPSAMLPKPGQDPGTIPEAEPVLAHIAWARVDAADAALALGETARAKELLAPVFSYGSSRINGYQSDRFRAQELWSHALLCRIALAEGDLEQAKLHAQSLPRMRHGAGPSKGAFPELEELGSELQDEVARLEHQARERGDERSDGWHPPDPQVVQTETQRIWTESGLAELTRYDLAAQNLSMPLQVALRNAVQSIVTPKSNRWREEVRFTLQLLVSERDELQERAEQMNRPRDPRLRQRGDGELYAALAARAEPAIGGARALAVARGYPTDALERDLASKSGPPGPVPFTGTSGDPDAHYAALCEKLGLPYLRNTDRFGSTPENMLSMSVRAAIQAIDAPRTEQWRSEVAQAFASFAPFRTQAETQRRTLERQIDELSARAGRGGSNSRIEELRERIQVAERTLELVNEAVAALRKEAVAKGHAPEELDAELVRLGLIER